MFSSFKGILTSGPEAAAEAEVTAAFAALEQSGQPLDPKDSLKRLESFGEDVTKEQAATEVVSAYKGLNSDPARAIFAKRVQDEKAKTRTTVEAKEAEIKEKLRVISQIFQDKSKGYPTAAVASDLVNALDAAGPTLKNKITALQGVPAILPIVQFLAPKPTFNASAVSAGLRAEQIPSRADAGAFLQLYKIIDADFDKSKMAAALTLLSEGPFDAQAALAALETGTCPANPADAEKLLQIVEILRPKWVVSHQNTVTKLYSASGKERPKAIKVVPGQLQLEMWGHASRHVHIIEFVTADGTIVTPPGTKSQMQDMNRMKRELFMTGRTTERKPSPAEIEYANHIGVEVSMGRAVVWTNPETRQKTVYASNTECLGKYDDYGYIRLPQQTNVIATITDGLAAVQAGFMSLVGGNRDTGNLDAANAGPAIETARRAQAASQTQTDGAADAEQPRTAAASPSTTKRP